MGKDVSLVNKREPLHGNESLKLHAGNALGVPATKSNRRAILSPVDAEYLGVAGCERVSSLSKWTWRRYAYSGIVASCKIGGRLVIPVSEVRRIMQNGMRPAVTNARTGK